MPIVNKANYVSCPSCGKWMHRLHFADYDPNAPVFMDLQQAHLTGNRAHICQECYERADAQPIQADQNEESKRKVAEQAKPFDTPVTRAKLGMPTDHEVSQWIYDHGIFLGDHASSVRDALTKFIERRNAKL